MKYIAVILLFCTLALTMQPGIGMAHSKRAGMAQTEKSCCAHKHLNHGKPSKQNQDDCCTNGTCTMLGCCNCCYAFYGSETAIRFLLSDMEKVQNPTVGHFHSTNFAADNFHPPEVV